MSEDVEGSSLGLVLPEGAASPSGSTDAGRVTQETPEEAAPGGEVVDEGGERNIDDGSTERRGPLGLLGLAGSCCVCVEVEQLRGCLHSEKICIVPILACLLSLALCTAGLKWVFVDKIFEYEPPTHQEPKRMGQDPIIFADPTQGFPVSLPHPSSSPGPTTTFTTTGQPEVLLEGKPTGITFLHKSSQASPTSALTYGTNLPIQTETLTTPKPVKEGAPTLNFQPTLESNDIVPKLSATSTTPAAKTSSHVTRCSDSHQNYCVNGGECFTLEVIPGSTKFLCRCPNEFTGDRCQNYVMASFYKHLGIEFMAEELYQKRVLTITGICIALLVVGIMCVVAYCKTKKQRKKLHDRLRQSLRNDRNSMANGPQNNPPLENVQLVNQYTSKKAMPAHHVIEKDTETSFSTSQCLSSAHQSTTDTHTSSQSWSNGRSDGVLSDSRSILVMSSVEGSLPATPSRRGRLNATGGARDLSSYLKKSRHSTGSCKDTPHGERYISAMTSPNSSPAVDVASPVTPGSPPSEGSAPLSSLATSLAVSPSGEEESPLLFATPPRENVTRDHNQYKRMSAHYNHGHDTDSPPPRIVEHENYESTQEYETATIDMACCPASIPNDLEKNNNNGQRAKRTVANGHVNHKMESNSSSCGSSESETEDERVGEDTPFLCIQIPVAMTLETAFRPTDSSRTNPALQLSPQDDLQARMPCVIVNQDPIAV